MDPVLPGWLFDLAHRDGIAAVLVALISAALTVYRLRRSAAARRPVATAPASAQRRRLLIVDDDPSAAAVLRRVLEAEFPALDVVLAETVSEAKAILHGADPPAVALIDCYLPDGNGWELARSVPRTTRVILMSGAIDGRLLPQLADGAAAVSMKKPIEIEDLICVVRAQLATHSRTTTP